MTSGFHCLSWNVVVSDARGWEWSIVTLPHFKNCPNLIQNKVASHFIAECPTNIDIADASEMIPAVPMSICCCGAVVKGEMAEGT